MTYKLQVIGDPIDHSLSPAIHAQFAAQFADDVDYGRERIPLEAFTDRVDAFKLAGGLGLNVTVPLKGAAFEYAELLDSAARAARAVNTIHFSEEGVRGYNTDGSGLVSDLVQRWQVDLNDQTVLLLGAGGASRGVVLPLFAAGVREIVIANRTVSRAEALCHDLPQPVATGTLRACGLDADLSDLNVGVVVNATSAGLSGGGLALPISDAQLRGAFCYDMGYGANAAFYRQVKGRARACADGLGMLVEQAAHSYEIWFAHRPDTEAVYQMLRAQFPEGQFPEG